MGGETIMWVVFAISFVGCAVTMGSIFIKPSDFEFLRGTDEPRPQAAKPATKKKKDLHEELDDALDDEEEEEETPAEDMVFKESVVKMMTFLETCLASLATKEFKFDSINKFGCHLFLAGAAEGASRQAGLNHDQFVEMLGKAVEVLGSNTDVAKKFSEKYEEYLLEPKYAEMFRSGGDAIEAFLKDAGDASTALADALEQWNKPAAESVEKDKLVTVLFTDLVGSTKMTQELGDAGAQAVLRKHNEIVRNGLAKYQGIEVKHTGDGIMARFSVTSNAVESAIWMQDAIAANNEATPDHPVNVRIGINTGEPIQEDGDIFGTTVQLAARICDKGKTGHVMTSNVVRELCAGRQIRFEDCGPFEMKGIEGPVNLYFAYSA